MKDENGKRRRVHPLVIDLSETSETSRDLILKALSAEIEEREVAQW